MISKCLLLNHLWKKKRFRGRISVVHHNFKMNTLSLHKFLIVRCYFRTKLTYLWIPPAYTSNVSKLQGTEIKLVSNRMIEPIRMTIDNSSQLFWREIIEKKRLTESSNSNGTDSNFILFYSLETWKNILFQDSLSTDILCTFISVLSFYTFIHSG